MAMARCCLLAMACFMFLTIQDAESVNPCRGNSCYFISTAEEGRSWDNNRKTCHSKGGDLVSIETLAEWQFINGEIQKKSIEGPNEWQIGLNKVGGVWKWINDSPFTLANKWQTSKGEPSGDGDVAVISKDYPPTHQGEFNDLPRTVKRAFICELPKAGGNIKLQPKGSVNPCRGNSCYFISTAEEGRSWDNNRETCQGKGGDLVSIETLAEWQFINGEIQKKSIGGPNEWHIGLNKVGGVWKWINDSPFTLASKWQTSKGQPNGDGNVAVISKDYPPTHQGEFNDLPRTVKRAFICELPKGSVNPCRGNSCYFISTAEKGRSWDNNRKTCQGKGGDLISIETLAEWQFINGEIQKKCIGVPSEWHIGLHKVGGVWKWINDSPFTLASKWQTSAGEPSNDGDVAVISKNYPPTRQSEFNVLVRRHTRAFICELPKAT
ncbi:hypothetical protein ACROYT_G032324 [Oculina patagonica]